MTPRRSEVQSLVIMTGMSGSGKDTALKAFEDLGYFCVDNLPTVLIPRLIQMSEAAGGKLDKLAIVVDVRTGESVAAFKKLFQRLRRLSSNTVIVFLDASDQVLSRRYSETRRVHPLAYDKTLLEGVRAERKLLAGVRSAADMVIETTDFTVHDLRDFIYKNFQAADSAERLVVSLVSFGFKFGLPHNSDMVFDVRFLPNPHFVEQLKNQTGNDGPVMDYVMKQKEAGEILSRIHDLLEYLLPRFAEEGKKYLTIAIGCTGGKHRSVVIANQLRERLEQNHHEVNLVHRDLHNQ